MVVYKAPFNSHGTVPRCGFKHVPKCKCMTSLIKVTGTSHACKIRNVLKYLAELRLK